MSDPEKARAMGPVGDIVRRNVEELRKARRLSLRALSELLAEAGRPIFPSGLLNVSRGVRRVDVDDLVALAKVLGTSPAALLGLASCGTCGDSPPAGFTCQTCEREGATP